MPFGSCVKKKKTNTKKQNTALSYKRKMSIENIAEIYAGHHSDCIKLRQTLAPNFYSRGVSMHTKV